MTTAGYNDSQYTILVQDYPSPIPRGSGFRYRRRLHRSRSAAAASGTRRQLGQRNDAADDRRRRCATRRRSGLTNVKTCSTRFGVQRRRLCENGVGLLEERPAIWKRAGAVDKTEWINQIRTISTISPPYQIQEPSTRTTGASSRCATA